MVFSVLFPLLDYEDTSFNRGVCICWLAFLIGQSTFDRWDSGVLGSVGLRIVLYGVNGAKVL